MFKTNLWGYPAGMRGNTFKKILDNFQTIKKHFDTFVFDNRMLTRNDFENLEKSLRSTGIGLSTLTKILYFKKIDIDNYNALIFDSRIIEVLNSNKFEEFNHLTDSKKDVLSCYNFLVSIRELSSLECNAEQIEHFLFAFGLNLKR